MKEEEINIEDIGNPHSSESDAEDPDSEQSGESGVGLRDEEKLAEAINKIEGAERKIRQKFHEILGNPQRPRMGSIVHALEGALNEIKTLSENTRAKFRAIRLSRSDINEKELVLGMIKQKEDSFRKELEQILIESYERNELDYRALYVRPELWFTVVNSKNYISLKKGAGILKNNLPEIINIVSKSKPGVKILDLGVGGGQKGEIIIEKFINEGKEVNYTAVDSVPFMLNDGTVSIVKNITKNLIRQAKDVDANSPWHPVASLIAKHNLKYSKNQALHRVLDRIFHKFANPEPYAKSAGRLDAGYFKHLFARMVSLHKGRKTHMPIIENLDNMNLPLNITPKLSSIENLKKTEFTPSENEAVISFDLGCRVCNQHPVNTVPQCFKYLSVPDPAEDESKIDASYAVIGFQPSHFDESHPRFEEEAEKIKEGYQSEEFAEFLSSPFRLNCSKYYVDGNELSFDRLLQNSCVEIETAYEKDPAENTEFYRIAHRLSYNRDIEIQIGDTRLKKRKGEKMLLHVSYKPTVKQMVKLFEGNGMKIVKKYFDNPRCPKYAKFLIRRKVSGEEV